MCSQLQRFVYTFALATMLSGIGVVVHAAPGRILDKLEVERADKEAYQAETQTFKSIGMGIALSLAQCEFQPECDPSVDKDELDILIDQLDVRINKLILKQEDSEEDYTEILTAYVDQRENYLEYQQQLDSIAGVSEPEPEEIAEDPFLEGATETEEVVQEESIDFSVFEDIGEDLEGSIEGDLPADDVLLEDDLPEDLPEELQ